MASAAAVFFLDYRRMTVSSMAELREALGRAGGWAKVAKNTLLALAAARVGLDVKEFLEGPTLVVRAGEDPAAVARVLSEAMRAGQPLVFKGGVVDGVKVLGQEGLRNVASLGSRSEMLARAAAAVRGVLARAAASFQAPLVKVPALLRAVEARTGGEVPGSAGAGG
jgi:large subunit ribosomal protein L10